MVSTPPDDPEAMIRNAADIVRLACEPLGHHGPYDFAASGLAVRACVNVHALIEKFL